MRRFILASIFLVLGMGASTAQTTVDYQKPTVLAAQQALDRLGYDVGTPDGAWGPKSRKAMNELRAAHGLPPADKVSGSSLMLVHQLSPGEGTLPRPGFFLADPLARRAWLAEHKNVASSQCPAKVGDGRPLQNYPPQMSSDVNRLGQPGDQDWWSQTGEAIMLAESNCMRGDDKACSSIVDMASSWAEANALQTKIPKTDERFENSKAGSNYTLRDMIIAYGLARQIVDVPPEREAVILDWFKDRVDFYYHLVNDDGPIGEIYSARSNSHGLAHMMPALAFGILVGDRSMMEPAIDSWRRIMKGLRKDGSIPTEMHRGAGWLHYSTLQLTQLIAINELTSSQGVVLNDASDHSRYSIPHALSFILNALADFDVAEQYSKVNFLPMDEYGPRVPVTRGFHFGFLPTYAERFGDDQNMQQLRAEVVDDEICSSDALKSAHMQAGQLCASKKPVALPDLIAAIHPEPFNQMGYAGGCLQGTKDWHELLASTSVETKTTSAFDGGKCNFLLNGLTSGAMTDTFAQGKGKVADGKINFESVKWASGLRPAGEDFSGWPLTITADNQLAGQFPLYYLKDRDDPPLLVTIDSSNSPVFKDKIQGAVDFMIDEHDHWTGKLTISCTKP